MRLQSVILKKYSSFVFQGNEIAPRNKTNKLCDNEDGVVKVEDDQHEKKAPPEKTGQENILDLLRWPLLFKYTVISTLLW